MVFPIEQLRLYVLTRHKTGAAPKDIIKEMTDAHGQANVPSQKTIYRWIKDIKEGCFELSKGKSLGRPREVMQADLVARVKTSIVSDPRQSVRMLSANFGVHKNVIFRILTEQLKLQKICSTWVPHELTAEHKKLRVAACKGILKHVKPADINDYVVQDEAWIGWEVKRTRAQNKTWLAKGQKKMRVVKPKLTNKKTMLLVAFTCSPPRFSITALPKGTTVDADCMVQFLKDTRHRFNNLRKHPAKFDDMILQMDNARPHTAAVTQDYLAAYGLKLVQQSPYSPDLNLCDRFLFTRLQESLRLEHFEGPAHVVKAAQHYCRSLTEETLKKEFAKLLEHCRAVIRCGGDYITS